MHIRSIITKSFYFSQERDRMNRMLLQILLICALAGIHCGDFDYDYKSNYHFP